MKQTHDYYYKNQEEAEKLIDLLTAKNILEEKTRINLYLPKAVVKLMDFLAKNESRGKLVSKLIIKEVKKKKQLPYGMFSPLAISEEEIDKITSSLEKFLNEPK